MEMERWRNRHFGLQYGAMECPGLRMLWQQIFPVPIRW